MEAARVDDCHRQAGPVQGHGQVQVINPRRFEHYAGHLAAKLLDQGLVPLRGLAELMRGERTPSTSHTHDHRLGADIDAHIIAHRFTSTA